MSVLKRDYVDEVFVFMGVPTITYVERVRGYEKILAHALRTGSIAFVYGPSKFGKTALCTSFVEREQINYHITVCQNFTAAEELFEQLARELNIPIEVEKGETVEQKRITGLKSLIAAHLFGMGEVSIEGNLQAEKGKQTEKKVKTRTNFHSETARMKSVLIFDNFHYIRNLDIQREILQGLRDLTERYKIGIVIIAITDERNYLEGISGELTNRVTSIKIDKWSEEELEQIPLLGFDALNVHENRYLNQRLIRECFGSPAIMQRLCHKVATQLGYRTRARNKQTFNIENSLLPLFPQLFQQCTEEGINMETPYQRLIELTEDLYNPRVVKLKAMPDKNLSDDKHVLLPEAVIQLIARDEHQQTSLADLKRLSRQYIVEPLDDLTTEDWIREIDELNAVSELLLEQDKVIRNIVEDKIFIWKRGKKYISIQNPVFRFFVRWSGYIVGIE